MAKPHGRRRKKRSPKPLRPGRFTIKADDLLMTLSLRKELKGEVEGLQECIDAILDKYDISREDRKKIKECIDNVESATEPIAFGFTQP